MSTTTTPLTDAELGDAMIHGGLEARAAAEIRALRAERDAQQVQAMARVTDENQGLRADLDTLLAALKPVLRQVTVSGYRHPEIPDMWRLAQAYAAIARAEGRGA